LAFLRHILHTDQIAALPHLTQELKRGTREETAYTLEMPTVVPDNLEACLGSRTLYFIYIIHGWKCCLKLGRKQASRAQTTDGTLAFTIRFTRGCSLGDTIWKSPRCHFRSASCVVHGQKAGRVSGCHRTKGACMHESPYHWQTPGLAKSEQGSLKYIYISIYTERATNFPPWWKHNEENLSDRFTAGFKLQPKHI